jgi:hypothetical protein
MHAPSTEPTLYPVRRVVVDEAGTILAELRDPPPFGDLIDFVNGADALLEKMHTLARLAPLVDGTPECCQVTVVLLVIIKEYVAQLRTLVDALSQKGQS